MPKIHNYSKMKKNETFEFTAPNGVKVTAVVVDVVDVLKPITEHTFDKTLVITKHLCYAQNRLFYYSLIEKTEVVIDEDWNDNPEVDYYYALVHHSHEVKSSEGHLNEIVVEYCILPEYDTILELASANFDKEEANILFS